MRSAARSQVVTDDTFRILHLKKIPAENRLSPEIPIPIIHQEISPSYLTISYLSCLCRVRGAKGVDRRDPAAGYAAPRDLLWCEQ